MMTGRQWQNHWGRTWWRTTCSWKKMATSCDLSELLWSMCGVVKSYVGETFLSPSSFQSLGLSLYVLNILLLEPGCSVAAVCLLLAWGLGL
jgi:hypothetical protein